MGRASRGFAFTLVSIVLLALAGTAGIIQYIRIRSAEAQKTAEMTRKFDRAHEALISFVSLTGRLPCPANPALDTGLAVPNSATVTCTNATGTLPWRSLGVRREDAIDAWGRKISYRVFTGTSFAGSMTQANGANMVNCDPGEIGVITGVSGGSGGLCRGDRTTHPGPTHPLGGFNRGFLTWKGFTVDNFGVSETNVAYVLISHGSSGLGGYSTAGTQLPLPTSTRETANLSACGDGCSGFFGGVFYAAPESPATVAATDSTHFDDVISWKTASDLLTRAGRGARVW